jgi:hypothetical protein
MEINLNSISLLQRNKNKSANPTPIPVAPQNIQQFGSMMSISKQQPKPTSTINKNKLPPPMSQIPKPSSEEQIKIIIQSKPPKKDVIEYLQKRCNDLTLEKMK